MDFHYDILLPAGNSVVESVREFSRSRSRSQLERSDSVESITMTTENNEERESSSWWFGNNVDKNNLSSATSPPSFIVNTSLTTPLSAGQTEQVESPTSAIEFTPPRKLYPDIGINNSTPPDEMGSSSTPYDALRTLPNTPSHDYLQVPGTPETFLEKNASIGEVINSVSMALRTQT